MYHEDEFHGVIGRTYKESKPWWPEPVKAPESAPNIVFIVLDDVGFSDIGCYGAEIRTPHMDALAGGGLRYTNFHVTAMCSPTRACLLTGRNAHSAGVGAIAEWSNGFPGYQGRMSRKTATIAEVLSDHGYGAYATGKWHLTNLANYRSAGPHPDWPLGRGFARWFGFLGGYVDHWNPDLHEDNHTIRHQPREGYHLSEDIVDHTIGHIRDHVSSANGRPFFTYLAFGAAHWPHHVPQEYIDRYKGQYDSGWDKIRESRLAKQKALGVVPEDTVLAPRNPDIDPWEKLTPDDRRVRARLQETYAAFMEHTDHQIGRLVDYLKQIGQCDNTVIMLLSDNGASGEGGQTGAVNIRKHMLTEKEDTAYGIENLDKVGGEHSFPHYPMGWAQVSNTPLKWYKKNTHGGGIRAPLIVHWPARILDAGGIRTQYHHVIDIVPTVLEVLGIEAPTVYRGVEQIPVQGLSMRYTWDNPDVPTRKEIQYFEIVGDRAIWHKGWKGVTRHVKGADYESDNWELYHLPSDFSEIRNLASERPDHIRELVSMWWQEAEKYGVLPLDDRETERAFDWFRGNTPSRYEYLPGMARADRLMIPAINDCSWSIEAELNVSSPAETNGVIIACGNRFGGFSFHLEDGKAMFEYIYTETTKYELCAPVPRGRKRVVLRFLKTGRNQGRFTLLVDDKPVAAADALKMWTTYGVTAGLTCGYANVPVTTSYGPPFAVPEGLVGKVIFEIENPSIAPQLAYKAVMQEE